MKLSVALFFATTLFVKAQSVEVPHKLQFADLTLTIRDDARKEIQKDVDALTRYPKSFNIKVERARTYFPIIEKIFAEENVPDDFKFLVIQESALISDAVSTSNAVGYWQFKDFTAIEVGLRVDKQVDERMNIVSSTRGAARYIKKNNVFFNNWLYALQAYQMGAGGVMRSEKDTKSGVKHLEITGKTYWYVKKYLAHKIAYEGFTKGTGEIQLLTYETQQKKRTFSEIAREVSVDEEQLKQYNKWLKANVIPEDRSYAVAIPVTGEASGIKLPEAAVASTTVGLHEKSTKAPTVKNSLERKKVNGIMAIRPREKETPVSLAARAGVDLSAFLKWNDISISDKLDVEGYYLLGKKRNRSTTAYHKVMPGETLWSISQQYGVQLKKLRRYNRLSSGEDARPGTTLWLSTTKPRDAQKARESEKVIEVNTGETFAWEVTPEEHVRVDVDDKPEVVAESIPQQKETFQVVVPDVQKVTVDTLIVVDSADSLKNLPVSKDVIVLIPADSTTTTNTNLTIPVLTNPNEHVVKPGETLYAIARQYKLGVMDLVNWNDLDLQQGIKPGQRIKLTDAQEIAKNSEVSAPINLVHEVRATDTVYSIARKYGVTIKDLMEWNDKKDFNLSVGEKLKVIKN